MQETLNTLSESNNNQIKGANNLRMEGIGEVEEIVSGRGWR